MNARLVHTAMADFHAARRLPEAESPAIGGRLHGHGFTAAAEAVLPAGWAPFPGAEPAELARRLTETVQPLDYRLLDDLVAEPTDEALAGWICGRLGVPGVERVEVRSTPAQGVVVAGADAWCWRRYDFEAAHRLPHVRPGHKCGRMHGHGFGVVLYAARGRAGDPDRPRYDALDRCWAPLFAELHERCLNDIPGLENPTSEIVARWIHERAVEALPQLAGVTVLETASSGAHFDGASWRIWKETTLDSAVQLRRAPAHDRRHGTFGHTYTLRLHLSGPLDAVLGWTVDYGDVKAVFAPVFERLDHQPLYELPGAGDNDAASLAEWIRRETEPLLPALDRIDLLETRRRGVTLAWGGGPAGPVVMP